MSPQAHISFILLQVYVVPQEEIHLSLINEQKHSSPQNSSVGYRCDTCNPYRCSAAGNSGNLCQQSIPGIRCSRCFSVMGLSLSLSSSLSSEPVSLCTLASNLLKMTAEVNCWSRTVLAGGKEACQGVPRIASPHGPRPHQTRQAATK
ncbi:hypothetical protein GOODEAATRI_003030 [Goodea atripinnis]|uniref:Uncharacterized protein n=1 Tax=Goodea atripinnis TaxID=208336 RepID=A0ABV0P1C8_9TELE